MHCSCHWLVNLFKGEGGGEEEEEEEEELDMFILQALGSVKNLTTTAC